MFDLLCFALLAVGTQAPSGVLTYDPTRELAFLKVREEPTRSLPGASLDAYLEAKGVEPHAIGCAAPDPHAYEPQPAKRAWRRPIIILAPTVVVGPGAVVLP